MIPNSSPLMGGGLLYPQRKLEKDSFAVDPSSSIIKLEACDHSLAVDPSSIIKLEACDHG
jgi:hypothetical protein